MSTGANQFGRIDVHAHLLPGVDDGCRSTEESIRCARMLVGAGYAHAFCTPHVWPNLPENRVEMIRDRVTKLQVEYDNADVGLTLLPGGEINLMWGWPTIREMQRGEVVTYGLKGKWVLFDFWADTAAQCAECIEPGVRHLRENGFELILAHPERVAAVHSEISVLENLVEMGVRLQMNTWCLTDPRGMPTRDIAQRLLLEGKYFLLGTDLHNASSMEPRLRGLEMALELAGEAEVRRLTVENPRRLIDETAPSSAVSSLVGT